MKIRSKQILYAAGVMAVLITGCVIYFTYNPIKSVWFPKCPFLMLTGLKCPGCGSQRATHALLHLDFLSAFRHNALLLLSIPYLILLVIAKIVRFTSPSFTFPTTIQRPGIIWSIFVLIILFGITRNIFGF